MNRYTPAAASLALLVALIAVLMPVGPSGSVMAGEIMVAEGGRLDAFDDEGQLIGPCPLKHTDVVAEVSGRLSRVTLTQRYANSYDRAIEAVYTFPLSHRSVVDRMTMTIGDRVVVGTVKERQEARRVYEAARDQGYVASLLEQERPNIFTQSVANIEPGAEVLIEISYVEVIEPVDGVFAFEFPMVVGPRYIPGTPTVSRALVPAELTLRQGVILLGPAQLKLGEAGNVDDLGTLQVGRLQTLLEAAQPIAYPGATWWGAGEDAAVPEVWYPFEATYCGGAREIGWVHVDGTGQLNGRWFFTDPKLVEGLGTGFAPDTNQVPDASRITPMPVRPPARAGHDISVTVTINAGGPAITWMESPLHEITGHEALEAKGEFEIAWGQLTVMLKDQKEIPNRDFVLRWRQSDEQIEPSRFAHTGEQGNFFTLMVQPPARIDEADVPPRELIFVLDTSGSMSGHPIEKGKAVMTRAIDAMRDGDTFNVITFAGNTDVLWESPRPATEANRTAARVFVESKGGGGGTEMMRAIEAALAPTPRAEVEALTAAQLADLPADGREVTVGVPREALDLSTESSITWPPDESGNVPGVAELIVRADLRIRLRIEPSVRATLKQQRPDATVRMQGRWVTEEGRRVLVVERATGEGAIEPDRMRLVMFLTDGFVGNDAQIIDAVRSHAGTTRVFSFGIGNSINRYLLDGMARAGRGEVEYVLLQDDADSAVERFTRRIETPVLTDIEIELSDGLAVTDTIPPLDAVPDLFDVKPLVIHGRYAAAGAGTMTIRGKTGAGRWERVIDLDLPAVQPEHDVIATLWARAKIDLLKEGQDDHRDEIIALGERFQIMTEYTSFVAVEHSRVVVDGKPMLVQVPIELPDGVAWEGIFGGEQLGERDGAEVTQLGLQAQQWHFYGENAAVDPAANVDYFYVAANPPTGTYAGYQALPGLQQRFEKQVGLEQAVARQVSRFGLERRGVEVLSQRVRQLDRVDRSGELEDLNRMVELGEITKFNAMYKVRGSAGDSGVAAGFGVQPLNISDTAFVGAIDHLQTTTGLSIQADWSALGLVGIDGKELVTLHLENPSLPLVLDELVGQVSTDESEALWSVQGSGVVISTPEALGDTVLRVYDVRDLLVLPMTALVEAGVPEGEGDRLARLEAFVRERLDADEFRGSFAHQPGALLITTNAANHDAIATLLAELRETPAIERAWEQLRRRQRLLRVLDATLHARLDDGEPAEPILVSILTADSGPATRAALAEIGLDALDGSTSVNHVVGWVQSDRLGELALRAEVRRVEAVSANGD